MKCSNFSSDETTMSQQDLLEMLQIRSFQPFRIHLTDGTVYEIRHPEMMVTRLEPVETSAA